MQPGAILQPPFCHFAVWAPGTRRVTLRLVGPIHRDVTLRHHEAGYHHITLEGISPGQRYHFRLDDGPDRPDPASRWQPDGVHGPSAVCDPAFDWHDHDWRGIEFERFVLYELHIGTFTPQGTFEAAIAELDRLTDLGVNALEIMPIAQFPGGRNWGYDGVFPFAVQHSYGGIQGFKRLVDACHQRGISVLLDVVYNHLGPEGNYFRHFGPYFTDQYRNPWGEALNFDGPDSDEVRMYFINNALMWQREFHLDGLRLDAAPHIKDCSVRHILAEIGDVCREEAIRQLRRFHIIAESDINNPVMIRPTDVGGWNLAGQWSDDFHHALHALVTGERGGYYADHGTIEHLARACRDGYVLQGDYSRYRRRRWGAPAPDRGGEQFVIFAQNHDQVGNRVRGERLSTLVDFDTLKLAAGLLLTLPYTPMLFMGEEYAESNGFPYFISHQDGRLIDMIRRGRKREFAHFGWDIEPPDPQDERTFQMAKLNTTQAKDGPMRVMHEWYRELLGFQRTLPALAKRDRSRMEVWTQGSVLGLRRWEPGHQVVVLCHFGTEAKEFSLRFPEGTWHRLLDSADTRWRGSGARMPQQVSSTGQVEVVFPPRSIVLFDRSQESGG